MVLVVTEEEERHYQLGQDPERLTLAFVMYEFNGVGGQEMALVESDSERKITEALARFDQVITELKENQPLKAV